MKNSKVSVVMPAYNHEKYVGEAIQSVLDQTFQDFELIIINDGSTDGTESEILKFRDDRIRYLQQENRGLSATLNRGIGLATGDYFNFLPSDDAFYPEKLEMQLRIFERDTGIGLVFAYPKLVDAQGREIMDDPVTEWAIVPHETKEEIFPALFERDFLSAPTALIRMECFRRVGLFDESLKTAQDYDMWMRILKYYDLRLIKKPLLKYRWHGANLTYQATPATEQERAKVLLKAYKNLTIEDIFPSLRQRREVGVFCKAFEKLADYVERSGFPSLLPISQIYRDRRASLLNSKEFSAEGMEGEMKEGYQPKPSRGDRRISILIETPSLDKGGMEEVIYNIATRLDPALFHPVVVCIERGGYTADRIKKKGIEVEILGEAKEKEYLEILHRYQIDLVNSHFSFFGPPLAHRRGIAVVSVLHNIYGWYSAGILDEFRIADQYVSKYIAVSKQVASFFRYRFNIDERKIKVIPDGLALERFHEGPARQEMDLKDLGLAEGDFVFLHIGAVTPAKMNNLLVAAMKEISKVQPEIKVISVGPALDKDYCSFIQTKIEESQLDQSIRLLGFAEDPSPYYRLAHAFLLPSLIEGWGIVTLEAMYHGLPLILTKVGGAEELVESEDIGILIENCCDEVFQITGSDLDHYSHLDSPKNTPELIEAMLRLYRDREKWKEKGKKGRTKVLSRYTWNQIIPRYEKEFIHSALERESEEKSRLEEVISDQKRRLVEKEEKIDDRDRKLRVLEKRLEDQTREMGKMGERLASVSAAFDQRFNSMTQQIDFVLARLSITERIKGRLHWLLKMVHKMVPKRFREKYRIQYRRFFFDKVFPDEERFERPAPPSDHPSVTIETEVDRFLGSVEKGTGEKFFVIYTTDPYAESRGQRSTWLARELARRGIPVLFFYWRWDPNEEVVRSSDPQVFPVPIDQFSKIEKRLFSPSPDRLKKTFLIEFPDVFLFEKINIANVNSFVTVYDCIDDWESFAEAGQAVWYDPAVEAYLVRNANLIMATNPRLAEKLRRMGADRVAIIPNGVDTESLEEKRKFIKSVERGALTIGYFGHLTESWFDWDLVLETALRKKDWFFHIIGYGEPSGLRFPENIRFWGKVEHRELPSYAGSWDVAIIPFKEGKLTQAVDPIKLYEYLFLGLPVVATNMGHLQGIPGVFSCSRDQFEETLLLAKEAPFPGKEVGRFIEENTWKRRVDQILEEIDNVDVSRDPLKTIG